ncbi:MAG: hypothetical protein ACYCY7_11220 [Gallionella sp.]
MKKIIEIVLMVSVFLALPALPAFSAEKELVGLKFKLDDDINTVKSALHTDMSPEPMPRNPLLPPTAYDVNKGKTVIHLRSKGIWVFFDPAGKAQTIRLDAPFADTVLGIKLGDNVDKITSTLGKPIKTPWTVFMTMQAYQYAPDDYEYVTFDVNDDGVQYIMITK